MSGARERTLEEVLRAIEQMELEEEGETEEQGIARILAKSQGELEQDLAAMGVDVARMRQKGEADQKRFSAIAAAAPAARAPARAWYRAPRAWLLAAAAVLTPAAGAVGYFLMEAEPLVGSSKLVHAHELRAQAKQACDKQDWNACKTLLDQARAIDPDGDAKDLDVARMRGTLGDKLPGRGSAAPR